MHKLCALFLTLTFANQTVWKIVKFNFRSTGFWQSTENNNCFKISITKFFSRILHCERLSTSQDKPLIFSFVRNVSESGLKVAESHSKKRTMRRKAMCIERNYSQTYARR